MSMLYYFFSNKERDSRYLFDDLFISKDIDAMKQQNQFPVIFISLKDMKDLSFNNQMDNFKGILSECVGNYNELMNSDIVDPIDKALLTRFREGNVSKAELKNSLRFITQCLRKLYQKKVVLLIDE